MTVMALSDVSRMSALRQFLGGKAAPLVTRKFYLSGPGNLQDFWE